MTGRIEKTVFISYRRTNFWTALAVFQNLYSNGYDVFFDYKSIPSGDFEQVITENVKARSHFIVILSPSALDRCNEQGDWLRREIETAIDSQRNIIPLIMEGFDFGSPVTLKSMTGKLADLQKYNALGIPAEYFDEAMVKLRSERFLNRSLESVTHPVSEITKRITEKQKFAAHAAALVEEKQLTAQEWYERGFAFGLNNDIDESIRCFTEAINLGPSYESYFNRGIARREIGDLDKAIQDYNQAIQLNPNEAQAYNNRGNARRDKGDLDGAISDYNKAIVLKPNATRVFTNRGIVWRIKGNLDSALTDFTKALRLNPPPVDLAEASYNLGVVLELKGKSEDAIRAFQNAINVQPYHVIARAYLISVFRKTENNSEADEHERLARKIIVNETEYNRACFEAIGGNIDQSLELLKVALENEQSTKEWARQDPDFENIRNDPRFKELVGE